jgi:hypothetical protein
MKFDDTFCLHSPSHFSMMLEKAGAKVYNFVEITKGIVEKY